MVGAEGPALRVGAPMWSHPQWPGRHIPAGAKDALSQYATWCNAVEGNTTFYAVPKADTVRRWSDSAPDDFRFCFKLPRRVTHDRRLRNAEDDLNEFLIALEPLVDRCGPTLIQLPPSFSGPDLTALTGFLDALPADRSWAVEVRHRDYFPGGDAERRLNDALAERTVDRVLLDSRPLFAGPRTTPGEIEAFANKPRLPIRPVTTGTNPVVRFIGQTDLEANRAYWRQWVDKVVQWIGSGLEPYFFCHTPDNVDALVLNRWFHEEISTRVEGLSPLPTPTPSDSQMDLFPAQLN